MSKKKKPKITKIKSRFFKGQTRGDTQSNTFIIYGSMLPIIRDDIGYWIIWIHGKPVENTLPTHSYLTTNEKGGDFCEGKDIPETYQNYQHP